MHCEVPSSRNRSPAADSRNLAAVARAPEMVFGYPHTPAEHVTSPLSIGLAGAPATTEADRPRTSA